MRHIQATSGYCPDLGYSVSICFGEGPLVSLEGLELEEIRYISDMLNCLLWDPDRVEEEDWPDGSDY